MTEQQVQNKIIKSLEENGYYSIKLIKTNRNGIPDIMALHPERDTLFIEVKTTTGKTSKLQAYVLNSLQKKGFRAYVVYGYEDYIEKIGKYL
jgi:Holliday junction resolvase